MGAVAVLTIFISDWLGVEGEEAFMGIAFLIFFLIFASFHLVGMLEGFFSQQSWLLNLGKLAVALIIISIFVYHIVA